MSERFSKRHGYKSIAKEITIRNEAPVGLREFIIQLVYELGHEPSFARKTICRVLKARPDPNNWSEHPYRLGS